MAGKSWEEQMRNLDAMLEEECPGYVSPEKAPLSEEEEIVLERVRRRAAKKVLGYDPEDRKKNLAPPRGARAVIGGGAARLVEAGEPVPDEPAVRSRLRPLWVLGLDGEARSRADAILTENPAEEVRALLEWFARAHEAANRPLDDG